MQSKIFQDALIVSSRSDPTGDPSAGQMIAAKQFNQFRSLAGEREVDAYCIEVLLRKSKMRFSIPAYDDSFVELCLEEIEAVSGGLAAAIAQVGALLCVVVNSQSNAMVTTMANVYVSGPGG